MSKEFIKPELFRNANNIIEEENISLPEELKQELEALYQDQLDSFKVGNILKAKVVDITNDGIVVNIDYKSYGIVPNYEFSKHEIKELQIGDELEVILDYLENLEGNVVVSYEKAKSKKAWKAIMDLHEQNKPVEGIVVHKVKGGLSVDIGIPAFLPGSQVDIQRVTDFDSYVGQKLTAHIIKINQKRGNVIISRRKYINEQRSEERQKILEGLDEGQVIQGLVKNITNYGVFIDVGGVDGLLHITDMTWGRIAHPSELVKIGDTITVKVLSFDKVNQKISLGMKQLTENPWGSLNEEIKEGFKLKGKVSSITDYGLFVEIEKGVEGLIHISEISWTDRISDLKEHFKVGQQVEAVVVSLDKENRRMSLSIKQLNKNPWDLVAEQYKEGQKITGKVSNITEFGIFIQIAPRIDGLVHISDFSWTEHIEHPADKYKVGEEVEAIVLGINKEEKKVSLGVKQLSQNPWSEIEKKYTVGSTFEGEVSKVTNFGAFVKLPEGIEGLVHISEFGENKDKLEATLKSGEKYEFKVIKVNAEEHKLALRPTSLQEKEEAPKAKPKYSSKKEYTKEHNKEYNKEYNNDKKASKSNNGSTSKMKNQLQIELEKLRSGSKE